MKHSKKSQQGKPRVASFEFIDFEDEGVGVEDVGIITREGVTVCPFGDGLVCEQPGCMACDDGVRCCSPGDTCILGGEENWCTAFRGTGNVETTTVGMVDVFGRPRVSGTQRMPMFPKDPPSFWTMR